MMTFVSRQNLQETPYIATKHANAYNTHKPKNAKAHIGLVKSNPRFLTWKIAERKSQIEKERKGEKEGERERDKLPRTHTQSSYVNQHMKYTCS